jgi:hypothetical protein
MRTLLQRQLVCTLLGVTDPSIFYENLKTRVAKCVGNPRVRAIESLGLLEEDPVLKLGTPLDSLCHFLSRKLSIGMSTELLLAIYEIHSILHYLTFINQFSIYIPPLKSIKIMVLYSG